MARVWVAALPLAIVAASGVVACRDDPDWSAPPVPAAAGDGVQSFREAATRVRPSTVAIQTTWTTFDETGFPVFGRIEGSGFVIADGLVVTNAHVVEQGGRVHARFANGEGHDAEVLGVDAAHDLAVIAVDTDDLVPVVLGRSESLRVGDPVAVIGDALGHEVEPSVRVGVVAGLRRSLTTEAGRRHVGLLELDLDLAEGQSGGPLIDRSGSVVGIATVASRDPGGTAFAIAIDRAIRLIDCPRRGC